MSESFIVRWARRKRAAADKADDRKSAAAPEATVPLVPTKAGTQIANPEGAALDSRLRGNERERGVDPNAISGASEPLVDLAKLPPIESITAETDIRAFLAPGVPPELARAALRRVWSADPAIRDFIGPAENAWDFNAPESMAGFGPLPMTDELRRQIARMVGLAADATDRPAGAATELPSTSVARSAGSAAPDVAAREPSPRADHSASHDEQGKSSDIPALSQRKSADVASQHAAEKPDDVDDGDDVQAIARRTHGRALPK
jgi:hypothetical protein